MKIKVVGFKNVDYVSKKTGKQVCGCNYYYTSEMTANNSKGVSTGEFYLSRERINNLNCDIDVGEEFNVYYNEYKQVEMLVPVNK